MKEFFERLGTLSLLIFLILAKAAVMILTINYSDIGLGPDEAQYWTWSQDLSWGYYSKPPGIAWQIALGTYLMGNTELGVRIMSVVIAGVYPLLVYFLAWTCGLHPKTCFWAGIVMALSPLGVMGSFFAVTDVGAIFFWILACLTLTAALNEQKPPNYIFVGLFIGLGALFKWPVYLLWAFIICMFPFERSLIRRQFLIGVFVSLLGLLPSFLWNMEHDWVTFRHVFSTLYVPSQATIAAKNGVFQGNFWDFLGAQVALLSPILFVLLFMSFWVFCKELRDLSPSLRFCGALSFTLLGLFITVSVFKKMQGNWVDFAYPTGIVFLSWYCCERAVPQIYVWLKGGVALSVLLCVLVFLLPPLQTHLPFSTPYKINPFKHNLGWPILRNELVALDFNPEQEFLFSDKYQMTSLLSFYNPSQTRAYFLNLQGVRKNQFSFWPGMEQEQVGKNGYFVLSENAPHLEKFNEEFIEKYRLQLSPYFQAVEFVGIKPLVWIHGWPVKEAAIFKCMDYNGLKPLDPELF